LRPDIDPDVPVWDMTMSRNGSCVPSYLLSPQQPRVVRPGRGVNGDDLTPSWAGCASSARFAAIIPRSSMPRCPARRRGMQQTATSARQEGAVAEPAGERHERLRRSQSSRRMRAWQKEAGLAEVRDEAAVANLPAGEREGWRKLWGEVANLLKRA